MATQTFVLKTIRLDNVELSLIVVQTSPEHVLYYEIGAFNRVANANGRKKRGSFVSNWLFNSLCDANHKLADLKEAFVMASLPTRQ